MGGVVAAGVWFSFHLSSDEKKTKPVSSLSSRVRRPVSTYVCRPNHVAEAALQSRWVPKRKRGGRPPAFGRRPPGPGHTTCSRPAGHAPTDASETSDAEVVRPGPRVRWTAPSGHSIYLKYFPFFYNFNFGLCGDIYFDYFVEFLRTRQRENEKSGRVSFSGRLHCWNVTHAFAGRRCNYFCHAICEMRRWRPSCFYYVTWRVSYLYWKKGVCSKRRLWPLLSCPPSQFSSAPSDRADLLTWLFRFFHVALS